MEMGRNQGQMMLKLLKKMIDKAMTLVREMEKTGVVPDIITFNILINGLCEARRLEEAVNTFSSLPAKCLHPNVCTYNTILKGLCKHGWLNDATELLGRMENYGCQPDECTYNTIIREFLYFKDISKALELVTTMRSKGCAADAHTTSLFLNLLTDDAVGPLCYWPGGLCLSRSICDTDVGEFIVPVPHVKQVKLSESGGRLIIASDGIWDTLSSDAAAKACRGLLADLAAKLVVKEALRSRGLKDDTTCLVVDIIPSVHPLLPPTPQKKHHGLSGLLFGKKSHNLASKSSKLSAVGAVEELFEEGFAMLAERNLCKALI